MFSVFHIFKMIKEPYVHIKFFGLLSYWGPRETVPCISIVFGVSYLTLLTGLKQNLQTNK